MKTPAVPCLVLSLLATLWSPCHSAFVIRSQNSNQWATALTRYAPLRRVMVISTIFDDGSKTLTASGYMDTDCQILMADPTGTWIPIDFEGPKLCVGGALVREANGGEVFFAGMEGNETILVTVDKVASATPTPGTNYPVLEGKIPVAMNPGNPDDDFIYVAMHDASHEVAVFGKDRSSNLKGIMDYWEKSTDPAVMAQNSSNQHVPHVTKMNAETGDISWLGIYPAQKGSVTIAAMAYSNFTLIIAGSTNGSGDVVGYDDDGDWDGYIAFVNPVTGNVETQFVDPDTNLSEQRGHIRLQSEGQGKNDYIYDMCLVDGKNLYVVGTTEGVFSGDNQGGAFVIKIDVQRRTVVEKNQVSGSNKSGLKIVCSESNVYIGGHVHNNDLVSDDHEQHIFVTAFDAALSAVQWSVEVSTSPYFGETRRDQLVALEINPAGDINVLLNSQVLASGINDIVLLDLQGDTGENQIQKGVTAGGAGGIPPGPVKGVEPAENQGGSDEKKKRIVISFSVLIPVLVALGIGFYTIKARKSQEGPKAVAKPQEGAPADDVSQSGPPLV